MALALILALVPACHLAPSQIYIPLAYGLTGLCIALLINPSVTAAIIGLVMGVVLGAAVYNNSLKRAIVERYNHPPSQTPSSE
ncbi:MAG: hypothetical protein JRI57_06625 [Deltaproteobacteria bacterium]|nr:hypothetical protein [Deltaproteobacteria bacterium]